MRFRTRKAAYRALVLSAHARDVFPNSNQLFHENGDVTVRRIRISLSKNGDIVIRNKKPPQKPVVKVSQVDVPISTSVDLFRQRGDEWATPNAEFSAQHIMTRHQPDGTHVSVDRMTIEGYEDHGPVPRPESVPDPEPDPESVSRGRALRRKLGSRLAARRAAGVC